jgi:hypothetical protein
MNDYDVYDDDYVDNSNNLGNNVNDILQFSPEQQQDIDFDDPAIASLPRILLMGPRRGGKTSIQVRRRKGCCSSDEIQMFLLQYFLFAVRT